ncbi:alpha/beta hydrolase [Microvirga puerhi]|uniref:Alpha/beta hydrolase n=1 Tax=Microvirga puerhi TaxID=2876078 RepID=A0ABS7VMD2_9HYPH|nr:alpha/beta hydrolase [Microvirga puerhi]MBZ6076686.1 alpha/beta hydrolase [Microvirga puerhi]
MIFAKVARLAALALLGLLLTACASRHGVLIPVDDPAMQGTPVEMLVATTREKVPLEDNLFSGGRGNRLAFADIVVSIPKDPTRRVGEVRWPSVSPGDPARDFVTRRAAVIDMPTALRTFHRMVGTVPGRRVLVFVHGYNNRFEDAVFRFAQFVHDAQAPVVPVLFTWPSRGSALAYGYDRESTTWSRNALEDLLTALAADPSVGEVAILAHSMGNVVTLEALRQMGIRNGRVPPKITNVMLAAPDVDVDIARESILDMGRNRPKITLFVSQDDRALGISRRIWGDSARLGAINPDMEPYRSELEQAQITTLNLTGLRTDDPFNHAKFAQSPQVVQIIGKQLQGGQVLTDSRVGLGDVIVQVTTGAAATVGKAAGLALSAPVAVIDPYTRGSFEEQVKDLGRTAAEGVPTQ